MSGPAIPLARPRPEPASINMEESRKATYQRVWAEYVNWGYTAPEPIGDSSDGIAPCGYEEL